jgi:predicted signal transduction protein with EAL and GGDEF domain
VAHAGGNVNDTSRFRDELQKVPRTVLVMPVPDAPFALDASSARDVVLHRHYHLLSQEVRPLLGGPNRHELLWRPYDPFTGTPLSPSDVAELLDAETAVELAVASAKAAVGRLRVTVNLPADAFSPTAVVRLAAANVGVVVEITESRALHRRWKLARLAARVLGVGVALDDAGTGFCNLARVRAVRPDIVKLDHTLLWSPVAPEFVAAARSVGAKVVCEGVEDAAGWARAAELGADAVQGWGVSHPVPFDPTDTRETWGM